MKELLPIQASDVAQSWDHMYYFLLWVCLVFFLIVIIPLIIFAIRYRKRPGHQSTYIDHNHTLEVVWSIIPTVIVMVIFVWGWIVYKEMITIPQDAMEIRVVAQQWKWIFQYEDGRITENRLFVPANKPVKLIMTALKSDVIHSFFVPNLRVKQDVVPGLYTYVSFKAHTEGQHQIFCAEYCGVGHSAMMGKLVVLNDKQWKQWWWGKELSEQDLPPSVGLGSLQAATLAAPATKATTNLVEQGKQLAQTRGCNVCHSVDGSKSPGPTYKGLFGSEVKLTNGQTVVADENYLRESIENPQAKIAKGYSLVMPPYPGQLNELEMNALVAYIKSLK